MMRGDPLEYLDKKIRHWEAQLRVRMVHGEASGDYVPAEKAISYIDAYRTMRYDLFGLPVDTEGSPG